MQTAKCAAILIAYTRVAAACLILEVDWPHWSVWYVSSSHTEGNTEDTE